MSEGKVFIDTNILVYAHDNQAGDKHHIASHLIMELWELPRRAVISVQVLQELYVTLLRKKIALKTAREIIEDYLLWEVVNNTKNLLMEAIYRQQRWKLSFWDSMIVTAAKQAGVVQLWSEDFNVGQNIDGIVMVNPLVK